MKQSANGQIIGIMQTNTAFYNTLFKSFKKQFHPLNQKVNDYRIHNEY